jgi:N-acetylmuramic acid 6-phosphate etherase
VLVGIAASGRTPYTVGAVSYARSLGAFTIGLTCVPNSPITRAAELSIIPVVGPEVVTGSSRLKAGTAQKMVLNMLSTITMVRLGYVSGNRMSNLQARNIKLRERAQRILMAETGIDEQAAAKALEAAGTDLRVALVMIKSMSDKERAIAALTKSGWKVEDALTLLTSSVE